MPRPEPEAEVAPQASPAPVTSKRQARLDAALAGLEQLDIAALRLRWRGLTGQDAPVTFRVGLLRSAVAYKLQERALGGLKAGTRRLLRCVAEAADPGLTLDRADTAHDVGVGVGGGVRVGADVGAGIGNHADRATAVSTAGEVGPGVSPDAAPRSRRTPAPPLRIKPGTRLLRTWQGRTHEVLVGTDGVSYGGQRYRSLSEVARLITGQRWSGPLFFGLKQRAASTATAAKRIAP